MATSTIKGGVQSFSCTLGEGITGNADGIIDRSTGIVTIVMRGGKDSDISIDDAVFTVPTEFRPSTAKNGGGIVVNSSNNPSAALIRVLAEGGIQQRSSNTARRLFGVIQYIL